MMHPIIRPKVLMSCALLIGALIAHSPAHAQALVIDGEEIADAALMDAARKEGRVLWYGTWPERNFNPSVKVNFERETGLKLDFVRLTTQSMYQRVTAEAAAHRLSADIIDITDPTLLSQLMEKRILSAGHKVPSFDRIAANAKDEQGRWYAFFRLPVAIGINTAIVKPKDFPVHWIDLLDPKWKDVTSVSSLDVGGSAFTTWQFMREKVDPEFWQRWRDLNVHIYPSVAPALADLVRGEMSIAVMGVTTIEEQARAGAPVKTIMPREGTPFLTAWGGLSSVGRYPHAAAVAINWVTSKHGGKAIVEQGAYAANSDAPLAKLIDGTVFPPVESLWEIPKERWAEVRIPISEEWRRVFGRR